MGLREMVLDRVREEGVEKGIKKGVKEGIEKGKTERNMEILETLIGKMRMSDVQAAEITGVSVNIVKQVRRKLKK
ncbi:MAG TPA: hypothetical protein VFX43_15200 [Chitinophagaceae bacterium]|jgi:flagellar biosynthesis/type III secretory pathway protein FliH|nr:hypothetical protein [Chitinophagaceae bacterium]